MAESVTIIIDDTALLNQPPEQANLGDTGGWTNTESAALDHGFPSNYNDTNFIPDFTPFGRGAWVFEFDVRFEFEYTGKSAALYGITPPSEFNQTIGLASPAFDGSNITDFKAYSHYAFDVPVRGGMFYTTGTLSTPTSIQIGMTGARGLTVDYAVVTVGEATNLEGQTIIVDDTSTEITWDGSWTQKNNYTIPVPCTLPFKPGTDAFDFFDFTANMAPHGNTSHASSSVGDSFAFRFAGTSILVSGVTPGDDTGSDWALQMEFTVDGNKQPADFHRDPNYITKPHFVYFSAAKLNPGNHTLVGRIVSLAGSPTPAAQIDYLTYKPSFAFLRDKPTFPSDADTASSRGSSSTASVSPSAMPTITKSHSSNPGAIAGGVVGGLLAVLAMLAALWLICRKRRQSIRRKHNLTTEPFIAPLSTAQHGSPIKDLLQNHPPASREPTFQPLRGQQTQNQDELHLQQSTSGDAVGETPETLETRMRELQTQMGVLTREMQTHIAPPSYRD
ncbi:Gpr1 family protein [Favolaschia claudopus]|uniref:Gpr1 family protein n=1 Tax=Favolaschia claudopus TaxID=2862362 RepID=A0AAW0D129_9AGAR